MRYDRISLALSAGLLLSLWATVLPAQTPDKLLIGGSMALRGPLSYYGISYKTGIDAALENRSIQGRSLDYHVLDDGFDPTRTTANVRQLLDDGAQLLFGNVGTPAAEASLALLAERNAVGVGFASGSPAVTQEDILFNFRPSYADETAALAAAALDAGLKPEELCVFAQNDALGMAAVAGLRRTLVERGLAATTVAQLDRVLALPDGSPERNAQGPVGVQQPGVLRAREPFDALNAWEENSGTPCRLVLVGTTLRPLVEFMGYARYKRKNWLIGVWSVLESDALLRGLDHYGGSQNLIVTQVVPPLDAPLPIVSEARAALGNGFNEIALEGFIAGRMLLAILATVDGSIDHAAFTRAARSQPFDLGGLRIDFTQGRQTGSELVTLVHYDNGTFRPLAADRLRGLLSTE